MVKNVTTEIIKIRLLDFALKNADLRGTAGSMNKLIRLYHFYKKRYIARRNKKIQARIAHLIWKWWKLED